MVKILDLLLKQVNESLKEWNVKVKLHKSFVDWIIEKEYKDYQERYKKLKEEKESIKELIEEVVSKKL